MNSQNLYVIAGCNGAGKTTASFTILPEILQCDEFINADEIARGIAPFHPETAAIEAGKIMLNKLNDLIANHQSFSFETTLSTRIYKNKIIAAKKQGYTTTLLFFWLDNLSLAKKRVLTRVSEGGHNIPPDTIERRYKMGIEYLFDIYMPIVDKLLIFDNSDGLNELIAKKTNNDPLIIINDQKFSQLKNNCDGNRTK
jgi:predicted ABC-type ATPase